MGSEVYTTEVPKIIAPQTIAIGVQVDGKTIGTISIAVDAPARIACVAAMAAYPTIPEGATVEYKASKVINFTTTEAPPTV